MARPEDRYDEAKVKFLTKAVEGTKWDLNAQQSVPSELAFQSLTNSLCISTMELSTYHAKANKEPSTISGSLRKSLWKDG